MLVQRKIFYGFTLAELLLILIVIIFSVQPVENYDFWFHVKYGEYITKTHTLPFTDLFSHTAYGTPGVPYEWLFQVIIYNVYKYSGTAGVQLLVVTFSILYLLIFRKILKDIFRISGILALIFPAVLMLLSYDFMLERPQIVSYFLFMCCLYLVLVRIHSRKNMLMYSIPVFLVWSNLHASFIIGLYLFFSFGIVYLVMFLIGKRNEDKKISGNLLLFGIISFLITFLPPLGYKNYQLLFLFFQKREFISQTISEWMPLFRVQSFFCIDIFLIISAIFLYIFILKRSNNNNRKSLIVSFLPLIPLALFVISGIRQTPYALPVVLILFIPFVTSGSFPESFLRKYQSPILIIMLVLTFGGYMYYRSENVSVGREYPGKAISFIKANIRGNMFNEYVMGGYIMYRLGPEYKTFIDGRTDMFLPEVLPEYAHLGNLITGDIDKFKEYFSSLVDKYHVSWVIVTNKRLTLSSRLSWVLRDDPNWSLVYFDDTAKIFVRNDGVNKETDKKYAIKYATPLSKNIYRIGEQAQAWNEYERMYLVSPSAVAANALGYILMEKGQFSAAQTKFHEALKIDPKSAPPKMNLGEISANSKNYQEAINLYREAINDDPERGIGYLRLGQLIIESGGSEDEARKIWERGLKVTTDEEISNSIRNELNKL